MNQETARGSASAAQSPRGTEPCARYVYCVVPSDEQVSLGPVGIDGLEVYTCAHRGVCALVHECSPTPYQSASDDEAAAWVLAHHNVVMTAWERWDTVLPLSFNTIVKGCDHAGAEDNLKAWLADEHDRLTRKLDSVTGKAEYGVQVFWDPKVIARQIADTDAEIKALQEELQAKSRGLAYMYRQRLDRLFKRRVDTRAAEEFEALYQRIARCVDSNRVEKPKDIGDGRQMLMNLSCLVATEGYPVLKAELDEIDTREGFSVRVAGPLPPYSFC